MDGILEVEFEARRGRKYCFYSSAWHEQETRTCRRRLTKPMKILLADDHNVLTKRAPRILRSNPIWK
jgi:hypothetical protein